MRRCFPAPSTGRAAAFSFLAAIGYLIWAAAIAAGERVTHGLNAPDRIDSPYLVLISIDGFGQDYRAMYDTPALNRIAAAGMRASSLRPVFPTLTFPNHFSIATGLYPADHGIVHNHFPNDQRNAWYHLWDRNSVEDGSWYSGVPIWAAAEMNGLVSAAYYFVGTEAPVGGIRPSYWYSFDESISAAQRVDQAIEWLELPPDCRPHVVTLYFEDVDDAGHDFGPGSPELRAAVAMVDANIGRLLDAIEKLGLAAETAIFVVSDHGQAAYAGLDSVFVLEDHIDLDGLRVQDGGTYAWIYQDVPDREAATQLRDRINANWTHGVALLRDEVPPEWRVSDSSRYPEIFVIPDLRYGVVEKRSDLRRIKKGDHGWAPENPEMHGIFLAMGPGLPVDQDIGEVSVVDIYPIMLDVLGIREPGHGGEGAGPNRLHTDE